ncbi:MAG: hypothetical protein DRR00_12065 [Candidatus Parabeggiatoa sp. nov. 3]|nr:MAG: hypothetical protein DRR00_12065 [Gammaproteobacteria bacterium]RKZ66846.1 MAG: hypothetical protein DRQ99_08395 [Gammaproteobacteria bacterium]
MHSQRAFKIYRYDPFFRNAPSFLSKYFLSEIQSLKRGRVKMNYRGKWWATKTRYPPYVVKRREVKNEL